MEEDGPSAGSAVVVAAARPNGWSSLTRLLRNASPPPRDPFPPLGAAANATIASGGAENRNHAQNHNRQRGRAVVVVSSDSGEAAVIQQQQQQQLGVASPASSAGSFSSSNYSGRGGHRRHPAAAQQQQHRQHQGDAQASFSSNDVIAAGAGSPPESSSGSFAPNPAAFGNNQRHGNEQRDRQHLARRGRSGTASSAGSFSLNPYRVQSGAYGAAARLARGGGGFQLGAAQDGRAERDLGPAEAHANGFDKPPLKRELNAYELVVVDEGRRDAGSAAERDVRPAVSDGLESIGDADRDATNGAHEQHLRDAGDSTAASSVVQVPMEPEWEQEDMYLRVRSDALKESRAREKFARGASQAYGRGDHRRAVHLSKQAGEKRVLAEKLHAEAAVEILHQRNNQQGSFDIWHLDLHGLHASEAVAALESRLALLEQRLANDHRLGAGASTSSPLEEAVGHNQGSEFQAASSHRQQQLQQDSTHKVFQTSKQLSIITGIGAHSQGGPTLPSAVKSFLINNGYKLEEPRAGVVSVRPKLRLSVP